METIRDALTPIIRENEQYRARLELARNFLPNGNPGDLNRAGLPKNKFRRGCYVARNGRDISLLMENPTLPGLFEEIPVNLMNGNFGALSMKIEIALAQIFSEVERAEKLHPDWPTNPIHQAAIVTEEAGELLQASLNHNEHRGSKKAMITEAIHTAASVIRFLKNINEESTDESFHNVSVP